MRNNIHKTFYRLIWKRTIKDLEMSTLIQKLKIDKIIEKTPLKIKPRMVSQHVEWKDNRKERKEIMREKVRNTEDESRSPCKAISSVFSNLWGKAILSLDVYIRRNQHSDVRFSSCWNRSKRFSSVSLGFLLTCWKDLFLYPWYPSVPILGSAFLSFFLSLFLKFFVF